MAEHHGGLARRSETRFCPPAAPMGFFNVLLRTRAASGGRTLGALGATTLQGRDEKTLHFAVKRFAGRTAPPLTTLKGRGTRAAERPEISWDAYDLPDLRRATGSRAAGTRASGRVGVVPSALESASPASLARGKLSESAEKRWPGPPGPPGRAGCNTRATPLSLLGSGAGYPETGVCRLQQRSVPSPGRRSQLVEGASIGFTEPQKAIPNRSLGGPVRGHAGRFAFGSGAIGAPPGRAAEPLPPLRVEPEPPPDRLTPGGFQGSSPARSLAGAGGASPARPRNPRLPQLPTEPPPAPPQLSPPSRFASPHEASPDTKSVQPPEHAAKDLDAQPRNAPGPRLRQAR